MTTAAKHKLIIFSDDWGRHPSSCQHLVARLVRTYPTLWVDTIGMRSPSLSREDLGKAWRKLATWTRPRGSDDDAPAAQAPAGMSIIHPPMWPGFRTRWQRKINAGQMARAVHRALGPREPGERRTVITTLPITADLIGKLDVDQWLYYCVDDFSVWPGLDGGVMCAMEQQQVVKADTIIAVSQTLRQRLSAMGKPSALLTHGIDLAHWASHSAQASQSEPQSHQKHHPGADSFFAGVPRPIFLFWGLIDTRLDMTWCRALADSGLGSLVMVGPQQSPDGALASLKGVKMYGPAGYKDLPAMARQADVLVMPYADLPVTRAMQPLKFKEYLATGKPVVARALPGIVDWQAAADLVNDPHAFVAKVRERLATGMSVDQGNARQRLATETWDHKARAFEAIMLGQ